MKRSLVQGWSVPSGLKKTMLPWSVKPPNTDIPADSGGAVTGGFSWQQPGKPPSCWEMDVRKSHRGSQQTMTNIHKTDLLSHLGNLGVSTFFISVLEHPKSLAGTLPWASSRSLSTGPKLNSSLTSSLLPQTVAFGLRFPLTHESIWELNMSLGLRYPQSIWELNMSVGPSLDQYYLPSLLLAMPPEFCHLLLVHRPLAPLFICHLDHLLILPISTLALLQFIFHGS